MKQIWDPIDIIAAFESEFSPLLGKFEIYSLEVKEARNSKAKHVWKPGCYVFWNEELGVLRVGRSFSNSRKRALEHIRDNTGGIMHGIESDNNARLILFNLKRKEDVHWVAAVEVFLESILKPYIPSGRMG